MPSRTGRQFHSPLCTQPRALQHSVGGSQRLHHRKPRVLGQHFSSAFLRAQEEHRLGRSREACAGRSYSWLGSSQTLGQKAAQSPGTPTRQHSGPAGISRRVEMLELRGFQGSEGTETREEGRVGGQALLCPATELRTSLQAGSQGLQCPQVSLGLLTRLQQVPSGCAGACEFWGPLRRQAESLCLWQDWARSCVCP